MSFALVKRSAITALLALSIFVVLTAGCGGQALPPASNTQSEPEISLIPGLSADQSRIVGDLGYPEQFYIAFAPYDSTRLETWIYPSEGKSSDFKDGRLSNQGTLEEQSTKYPPTTLHPQDFTKTMTVEEASVILGSPVYTQEVENSLMGGENTLVVFNNAILLFRAGGLLTIDTQVKPPEIPSPK